MENAKMRISDICFELEELARSSLLTQRNAEACRQAVWSLRRIRDVILTNLPETIVVETIENILTEDRKA
jgi:hypothetical protein